VKLSEWLLVGYVSAFLTMLFVGLARQRRIREDRLDTFTDASVQRGWRFGTTHSGRGYHRDDLWDDPSGAWTVESVGPVVPYSWDPRILRWWNAGRGAAAPSGPVVALFDTGGKTMPDVSKIEGGLARFAARRRFARAFKRHFGEALSLDGRDLQRVDGLGPLTDGFDVLSDQPAEAARRLTPALLASIRQVWSAWADIGVKRPGVALCGDRIAIACVTQQQADIAHVAVLVEAGAALTQGRG